MLAIALTSIWNLSIGLSLTLPIILLTAFVAGIAIEIFGVVWMTSLQRHIPEESYSRVVSYDTLGSYALAPIGIALAGPVAEWIGTSPTLIATAGITLLAALLPLTLKSVRELKNQPKE